jgi:hypothetical protein
MSRHLRRTPVRARLAVLLAGATFTLFTACQGASSVGGEDAGLPVLPGPDAISAADASSPTPDRIGAGDDAAVGIDAIADPDPDAGAGPDTPSPADDAVAVADAAFAPDVVMDPDAGDPVIPPPPDGGSSGPGGPAANHFAGAYASPTILRDGAAYHAYFAGQSFGGRHYNAPHITRTGDGGWHVVGDALPHLGHDAELPVWAPAAAKISSGHFMLYYTAKLAGTTSKKCLWRAHATSADGPFVDDFGGPIECLPSTLWAIDPYLVKDARGTWHLAARLDQPGGINTIQIRELDEQGQHFAAGSSWVQLTHNAPGSWEQPVLENAGVVRLRPAGGGEAHWFVFYSARAWDDASYAIGYADCGTGIDGPCVKKTPDGPWLASNRTAGLFGPGTPTFYPGDAGEMLMSVQAWKTSGGNATDGRQIMRTYTITVDDAYVPHVRLQRVDE